MRSRAQAPADEVAKFGVVAKLWALIEHLAEESSNIPMDLRGLWLVWTYDAEVKNGGHLQYFHNRGIGNVQATLGALREIGAEGHAQLLEECWAAVRADPVERVGSLEEYSAMAHERSFDAQDSAYYALPDVTDLLAQHNQQALDELVEVRV